MPLMDKSLCNKVRLSLNLSSTLPELYPANSLQVKYATSVKCNSLFRIFINSK
jgi:hypothetical protein